MDHAYVEENGLVAQYRTGRLDPEEERRFEEHYFACAACQEELDHQRRFERGLQAMRAEDAEASTATAAASSATAPPGKLLRFPRRPTTLWLALAASLLLAAALPYLLLRAGRAELEREAAAWRERAEGEEAARRALATRLAESERLGRESEERVRRLESRLAEAQAPPARPSAHDRPIADTSLLLLTRLRGTEPGKAGNRLDLRRGEGPVQLALDPGGATGFASYRATLADASGKKIYQGDALHPNALEVILLTFPRDFLAAGEYRLLLEGRRPDGAFEEIEGYRFRVVR